jgi:YidC/Oxa1 family membrane protein insertase
VVNKPAQNLPAFGLSKKTLIIILIAAALIIVSFTYGLVDLWNTILLEPMLNFLILLSDAFFDNFGIAIIILVIIVRLLMLPLTLRQLRSTKAMQSLQPKMKALQDKYGKDKQQLQQEMMKLYKESGVNPLGCLGPLILQLPIWIALYQSILKALAATPEELLGLSERLYSLGAVHQAVPLNEHFLWLNLAQPDVPPNGYFILPVLVAASMWVLQKMSSVPTADPRQQSMNKMMLWMLPLMFAFFTLSFPSGLALFWVVSNLIGIVTQYFITGWGSLGSVRSIFSQPAALSPQPQEIEQSVETPEAAEQEEKLAAEKDQQEGSTYGGKARDKRKDRRRGRKSRSRRARRKS